MALTKVTGSGADGLTLSSTDVTVASGDLLFGTADKGVVLGVTSNTDGNTLDDYEEGSFTPVLIGTDSAGTGTYGFQRGGYVKIGRLVYVQIDMQWTAHTGTGNMRISGLPFTSADHTTLGYGASNMAYASGLTFSKTMLGGYVGSNGTQVILNTFDSSLSAVSMDTNVSELLFNAFYIST